MATWRVPDRWAATSRSAMSVRIRPLLVVASAGRSSARGPSTGPEV
jgi:hypothetical protein